jgi:hypothetical protein
MVDKDRDHISWPDMLAAVDHALEPARQEGVYKHLAECRDCLQRWQEIRRMRIVFSAGKQPESPLGDECLDEEKIAGYLDRSLAEAEFRKLNQHIQDCDFCFCRLAYAYKCHQRLKLKKDKMITTPPWLVEKALSLSQSTSRESRPGWIPRLGLELRRLFGWIRAELFSPVPGYTLAGICLLLLLWQGLSRETGRLVSFPETTGLWVFAEVPVAYRDNAGKSVMTVDESRALYREPHFAGMKVKQKKGWGLVFTWPKMKDTQEYNFTLLAKGKEKDRILVSVTTREEKYEYSYKKYGMLDTDQLYEWVVSGNYGDGLHFKARASFTIVK